MVLLSPNFSLEEMTATEVRGVDNTPPPSIIAALKVTAAHMETVRTLLGNIPIHVNSGYRSPQVNAIVGGSLTSSHMDGQACDFICPAFGTPFEICRAIEGKLQYDQLIFEEDQWAHIGFREPMRNEVLTKHVHSSQYLAGLVPAPGVSSA